MAAPALKAHKAIVRRVALRGAPKAQIQELAHLAFVQRAENVVLLGPSGVGKTHIALALGQRAVIAGYKVRFISAADLVLQLAAAKSQGRLKEYFNRAISGPKRTMRTSCRSAARATGSRTNARPARQQGGPRRRSERGRALLGRYGLRPTRPSSAIEAARVGQIYFGDQVGK